MGRVINAIHTGFRYVMVLSLTYTLSGTARLMDGVATDIRGIQPCKEIFRGGFLNADDKENHADD